MAMELAPRSILLNAIAPGLIATPLLLALTPVRLARLARPAGRRMSRTSSVFSRRRLWISSPAKP
jgi:NAD(P)-dependent dehydrogenase (short-subunit alcohol dehydrogenase family)